MYSSVGSLYWLVAFYSWLDPVVPRGSPLSRPQQAIAEAKGKLPRRMAARLFGDESIVSYLIPPDEILRLPELLNTGFVVAYGITNDGHDAIDTVAQTLFNVAAHPTTPDNFEAYFLQTVRNADYSIVRRRRLRQNHELLESDGAAETLKNGSEFQDVGLAMDVRSALAALDAPYRQVAELHYLCGYTRPEIATELGAPLSTINNWVHRARRQLRETLAAYGCDEEAARGLEIAAINMN